MATATSNRTHNLRGCPNSRVRPDYRVLNPGAFLNKATRTQNRIDDLGPWFNLTIVTNHRGLIDFSNGRRIELSTSFFNVNSSDTIREEIRMDLQVSLRCADVDPVGPRRNMSVERFFTLQQIREQSILKRVVLTSR